MAASPQELRLMLLEGALKYARQGRLGLEQKNFEASFTGMSNCRDIVMELMTTIRREPNPELADSVKALYTFMYTTLVEASLEKDVAKLDAVIQLLEYERETWVLLMQKLASERGGAGLKVAPADAGMSRAPLSLQG
jgi:flagellar protein FliS